MNDFIKNTLLYNINKNIEGARVHYGKFLRWLGIWFLMATVIGPSRNAWFSQKPFDEFSEALFHVVKYMAK